MDSSLLSKAMNMRFELSYNNLNVESILWTFPGEPAKGKHNVVFYFFDKSRGSFSGLWDQACSKMVKIHLPLLSTCRQDHETKSSMKLTNQKIIWNLTQYLVQNFVRYICGCFLRELPDPTLCPSCTLWTPSHNITGECSTINRNTIFVHELSFS